MVLLLEHSRQRNDMDFAELHSTIPYVYGGKRHLLEYHPYNGITLRLPGRHQNETDPKGGDFVVCVDDEKINWVAHQFTHRDIFNDLQKKVASDAKRTNELLLAYACVVVEGKDPENFSFERWGTSLHPETFLYAVQALSVAEHRRYVQFESRGGGRYLPLRFAYGIVNGLWTAQEASAVQKQGRQGVEFLEKNAGIKSGLTILKGILYGK